MSLVLEFPLPDVLTLAEHAVVADRVSADDGAPAYPALLLIVDHGIYLRSNAVPALPPAAGQPLGCWVRAVYAAGHGPNTPTLTWMLATNSREGLTTDLSLRPPAGHGFVATLSALACRGFDTLRIDPCANPMPWTVTRCGNHPA